MIKLSLRLDKRYRLANGKYPVKIAIARNGKTLYLPLNFSIEESNWNPSSLNHVKNIAQKQSLNTFINSQLSLAELKIQELQSKGILKTLTDKQLLEYLSVDKRKTNDAKLFKTYATEYIDSKKKAGTKDVFVNTIKAIERYCDYDNLSVEDISKVWVEGLVTFLQDEGKAKWTIASYITKLKSIYGYILDKEVTNIPFPKVKLKHEETKKRSLPIEDIRKLAAGSFKPQLQKYADLFMLLLMMRGINMRDISKLPHDAVHDGRLQYTRQKTGKYYDIKIEPEMLTIIERYKGKKYLLRFFDGKDDEKYYRVFGNVMSKGLRNACKEIGIEEPVSPYYSRHSWATLAVELGASMEMVSAGLGHEIGAQVTQIYVAFQQKQIDELSRRVIDYIYKKGEYAVE